MELCSSLFRRRNAATSHFITFDDEINPGDEAAGATAAEAARAEQQQKQEQRQQQQQQPIQGSLHYFRKGADSGRDDGRMVAWGRQILRFAKDDNQKSKSNRHSKGTEL